MQIQLSSYVEYQSKGILHHDVGVSIDWETNFKTVIGAYSFRPILLSNIDKSRMFEVLNTFQAQRNIPTNIIY